MAATKAPVKPAIKPVEKFITTNGVRLRYFDYGNEGKMPLICLHGNRGQAHIWDEFADAVAPHYHVYTVDQRGHGESQWAADGYHRDSYVADLASFMDQLKIKKAVLVGLSMGGWNSLLYAVDHPERVDRFIMVDIGPDGSPAMKANRKNYKPEPLEFFTLEEAHDWNRKSDPWATEERRRQDIANRMRQHPDGKWRWKVDPAIIFHQLPDNYDPVYIKRYWDAMKKVQCPFMEVRGAESLTLDEDLIEKMKKTNKLFSAVTIPGAGHVVTTDKPYEFIKATKKFLGIKG
jgi:pimeloyl-ACP methyl ester carboxylesterase